MEVRVRTNGAKMGGHSPANLSKKRDARSQYEDYVGKSEWSGTENLKLHVGGKTGVHRAIVRNQETEATQSTSEVVRMECPEIKGEACLLINPAKTLPGKLET